MKYLSLLFLLPFARFVFAGAVSFANLSGGGLPLVRFSFLALAVLFGPGLALLRLVRKSIPEGYPLRFLFVLSASIAVSGLVAWGLYFFGCYTRVNLLVFVGLAALGGLYGLFSIDWEKTLGGIVDRWNLLSVVDKILLLLFACFLEALFEKTFGEPYIDWDAIVSWDKWSLDMSMRKGLGGYLMGAYPQFYPAVNSIFYKCAQTGNIPLPPEQLFLHGLQVVYPALLGIAMWCMGRRFHFHGLIAFFLFVSLPTPFQCLANGYADVPLTAMLAVAFVLTDALYQVADDAEQPSRRAWIARLFLLVLFFLPCILTKATGALWLIVFAVRLCIVGRRPARLEVLAGLLVALLIAYPYFSLQKWLMANPACTEKSPFLHSLPLVVAHTSIFKPDLQHFLEMIRRCFLSKASFIRYPLWLLLSLVAVFAATTLSCKRSRGFSIFAIAALSFWFFTASYDLRNAFPALCVASCAVASLPFLPFHAKMPRKEKGRNVLLSVLLLLLAVPAFANSLFPLLKTELRRYHATRTLYSFPCDRHMVIRPEGDLRNILYEAPYGKRARHLIAGTHLYRVLAPKGVYAIQLNSYNDSLPYDIMVQNKRLKNPPESFSPVATIRRAPGYTVLWMSKPSFSPCDFRVRPMCQEATSAEPRENALVHAVEVPAGESVEIELSPKPPVPVAKEDDDSSDRYQIDPGEIRDGIVEIKFSSISTVKSVSLVEEDAKRDPFGAYITPFQDPDSNCVKILYWMKEPGPALPRLKVVAGEKPVSIKGISLSRARY